MSLNQIDDEFTRRKHMENISEEKKSKPGLIIGGILFIILVFSCSIGIYQTITEKKTVVSYELTCEQFKDHLRSCNKRTGDDYVHCLALLDAPKGCY